MAQLLKHLPPIFLLLLGTLTASEISPVKFRAWWKNYRENSAIPSELKIMEDYFVSSSLLQESSKYWLQLSQMNIKQLTDHGYENFKQTVACNYFTWLVNNNEVYSRNLYPDTSHFLDTIPDSEIHKKHALFSLDQSIAYNKTTALLYNFLLENGARAYLEKLEEPAAGNPPTITIRGKSVSQDLLNSLLEYLSVASHCPISNVKTILEVGAGSGRTAHTFLQELPNAKYIIIDIPPALYLSQKFLTDTFPNKKSFLFREFSKFEEIQEAFQNAELVFMTPDQMRLIPDHSVDLYLAIDCLHEMKRKSVQFYLDQAQRLASLFYFKCWTNTVVPYDNIHYPFEKYPIPTSWKKIFEGDCVVPSDFSHAFYQVRS